MSSLVNARHLPAGPKRHRGAKINLVQLLEQGFSLVPFHKIFSKVVINLRKISTAKGDRSPFATTVYFKRGIMRRFVLHLFCFLSSIVLANPQIDSLFRDYDKPGVPGASVAVYRGGMIVYEKGYGLADVAGKVPSTEDTNFRLASVSKQFTAVAVLILIEQGKLSFETRLTDLFPGFPAYGRNITIRHLLNHTGGLRDYEDLIPSTQSKQLSDQDVLELLKKQSSGYFTPGSQYRYSNGGYVLLGLSIEAVTQKRFATFANEYIFEPLGMKNSVFYEKGISAVSNRAYGYSPSGTGFSQTDQSITSATLGDGGLYTSVHEWLLWENALRNSTLLSEEVAKLAWTPGTLNSGSKTQYGFGWMLDTYKGYQRQHHTGSTIGFRTACQRFPEKDLAILVLINRANSTPWEIARQIADLYL